MEGVATLVQATTRAGHARPSTARSVAASMAAVALALITALPVSASLHLVPVTLQFLLPHLRLRHLSAVVLHPMARVVTSRKVITTVMSAKLVNAAASTAIAAIPRIIVPPAFANLHSADVTILSRRLPLRRHHLLLWVLEV